MSGKRMKTNVEDAISQRLKEYYDAVEQEPIPDEFLDLLEKLDEAETRSRKLDEGKS